MHRFRGGTLVKKLTRKQVSALKRALARKGQKLPKVGWCKITTKAGGRYDGTVRSGVRRTSEVCHDIRNGRHVYEVRAHSPRELTW